MSHAEAGDGDDERLSIATAKLEARDERASVDASVAYHGVI